MPNWVNNIVKVEGAADLIESFFDKVTNEDGRFTFENIISPEGVDDYDKTWYSWNINNWGTKWDACNPFHENSGDYAEIEFNTAWSVPTPVWEAMAAQYPDLSFEFDSVEEQGWGRRYTADNGELVLEESWEIPSTHAEFRKRGLECPYCDYYADEEYKLKDCPK